MKFTNQKPLKASLLSLLLLSLICSPGFSQEIDGAWHAIQDFSSGTFRLNLHIESTADGMNLTIDNPDAELFGFAVPEATFKDGVLSYRLGNLAFNGKFYPKAQLIIGELELELDNESYVMEFGREEIPPPANSLVGIREKYDKAEYYVPMRDGKKLFTSVYTPKDHSQAYPILLMRNSFNSEANGEEGFSRLLFYFLNFVEEGYILVFQDLRGYYMSEGSTVDAKIFNPKKNKQESDENSDAYDTIEWLIQNLKHHNGKVGMVGRSYPALPTTMALPDAHPALKAVSPQAPLMDPFIGDTWHRNGAFSLMRAFQNCSGMSPSSRQGPTRSYSQHQFQFHSDDSYEFYLDLGPVKNAREKYFGDSIQFWLDLMSHPNYDDFWQARNRSQHLKKIKPAVLVVGGWFDGDELYGTLDTYETIENRNKKNQNRLIMGPWSHIQWVYDPGEKLGNIHFGAKTAEHFKELELQFFNYYLKDKGTMDLPEASIFITGTNEWRAFESWPPAEVQLKTLFLQGDHQLSFSPPEGTNNFDEYAADPAYPVPYTEDVHLRQTEDYLTDDQRFASRRPDVMTYQTEVLTEDITLAGPVEVNFFVSTTGTDADYVVKIIDVFPDQMDGYPTNAKMVPMGGYQMLVRGDVLRGKYRNSFEEPEPFVPNEVTEVSFSLLDFAHTFQKGHRIMIQVQNSWFPLVDRNPQQFVNIYECEADDFIKATHRIYHDAERPSSVTVGVLKKQTTMR
jgi:putative CocE/NonD family hydrolase